MAKFDTPGVASIDAGRLARLAYRIGGTCRRRPARKQAIECEACCRDDRGNDRAEQRGEEQQNRTARSGWPRSGRASGSHGMRRSQIEHLRRRILRRDLVGALVGSDDARRRHLRWRRADLAGVDAVDELIGRAGGVERQRA